ncbi:hypothetical protein ACHHV8_33215 [Paenibacillus sp. TAB 01]|uniref:hypothetical protein n=1 Tax=Paenibacillus sp. TAB 01 TaxID=3368988 RepID=UPI00375341A4
MLIISTFEHSLEVEEALAVLEQKGVARSAIMLIPMDSASEPVRRRFSQALR